MQQKESREEGNRESMLSLCDTICCRKLCNLLSEGVVCSQSKAVRLSLTHLGPHSVYEITIEFQSSALLSKDYSTTLLYQPGLWEIITFFHFFPHFIEKNTRFIKCKKKSTHD